MKPNEAGRKATSIFRVWTTNFEAPDWRLWNDSYVVTEAARETWGPVDSLGVSCVKGMQLQTGRASITR